MKSKAREYVVKTISMPADVVAALRRRQDRMSQEQGRDVSFSAATASALSGWLRVQGAIDDEVDKTKTKKGARSS